MNQKVIKILKIDKYLTEVFKKLGFQVKCDTDQFLTAKIENKAKEDLTQTLTEVTRLIASTKNLDFGHTGLHEKDVPYAVDAFLQGTTDIYGWINNKIN